MPSALPPLPPAPPPLPRGLADSRPIIIVGIIAWCATALVFLLLRAPSGWTWTTVVGILLGVAGYTVMHLQRRATQRAPAAPNAASCNPVDNP